MSKLFITLFILVFINVCIAIPVKAEENAKSSYASSSIPLASQQNPIPFATQLSSWENSTNESVDFYKVNIPEDGKLVVTTSSFVDNQHIELYNENSTYLTSDSHIGNIVSKKVWYLTAGTYYIKYTVVSYFYKEGNYSFNVDYQPTYPTITQYHGSLRSASLLPAVKWNQENIGQISVDTGYDYFKFQVSNECTMKIAISSEVNGLWMGIRDENEKFVAQYNDYSIGSSNSCVSYHLYPGTYYLRFFAAQYSGGKGLYYFTLRGEVSTPNNISIKPSKKKFTISIGDTGYHSGYEIKYKQSNVKKWKTIKISSNKTVKKTVKKLKSGKKYKVKVRSYNYFQGQKKYSDWSPTLTVKVR